MKYKDLIEKLLPYAEEEINMLVSKEHKPADFRDLENWNNIITDKVYFYRNCEDEYDDNNDIIVSVEQSYDSETYENIDEAKLK